MIISYKSFQTNLNSKLFENSYSDLLQKNADNPERYIGLFRPTKPKTKLIQNITQSHEIRFGDALECIFEQYFAKLNFNLLPKRFITSNNKALNIDQLFSIRRTIYLIEQKVRDDHDSTKKKGQFDNFVNKYEVVKQLNRGYKVVPIMWFIDDTLTKNRKFYQEEIDKMSADYGCEAYLFYGEELFAENGGIADFPVAMWKETLRYLKKWKDTLPDMPEVNFDIQADNVFAELKNLPTNTYRKLFDNEEVIKQIFPIIFPEGTVLNMLANYFDEQEDKIYHTLAGRIRKYLIKSVII